MLTAWLLLTLAAPHYPFTCPTKPSCFRSVRSMQPLDGYACEVLENDLRLAQREFERHGIASRDQVCEMLHSVDVRVVTEQTNFAASTYRETDEDPDSRTMSGSFFWKKQKLMVSRSLQSLAHEILHAWEWIKGDRSKLGELPGTWEQNSEYLRMLSKYEKRHRGMDKELWSVQFKVDRK